ncbi:biotin/lipoyl-containing protein, partial [Lentzea sp. NPDC006480]|uniref:biotin/lipoyl-containing protein n=1 Tax=Lentzea sp. NPDC006480 TaxID=3157176 RepID=UPI0033AE22E6
SHRSSISSATGASSRQASGTLHRFEVPGDIRLDSGVEDGSEVSVFYDPMLAKVIACAPTRAAAARKLATALESARIHGLITNRQLLVDILRSDAFLNGDTHTGFLAEHDFTRTVDPQPFALAAALAQAATRKVGHLPLGWRNVRSQQPKAKFLFEDTEIEVEYDPKLATENTVTLDLDGVRTPFQVARYGDLIEVDSPRGSVSLKAVPRFPEPETKLAPGATIAPMPGTVVRVSVSQGDHVEAGAELLVLEAMKMEHRVLATNAGTVTELLVEKAQQVNAGDVLAVVEEQ